MRMLGLVCLFQNSVNASLSGNMYCRNYDIVLGIIGFNGLRWSCKTIDQRKTINPEVKGPFS